MTDDKSGVDQEQIESLYKKLKKEAEDGGYTLNPDADFSKDLAKGLIATNKRYGYPACPCRLASGKKDEDLDIICPCDYRDQDITEFNACYCALYVSDKASKGEIPIKPIPERRPPPGKRNNLPLYQPLPSLASSKLPVWRCKVCGYLCAREDAPDICPICKAKKDRFERFS